LRILKFVPLFAFILAAYNIIALNITAGMDKILVTTQLLSGAKFQLSVGNLLVLIGIIFLYFEIFKSTKSSINSIVNHSLSMLIFIIFLIEFIVLPEAGTATFIILTLMSLIDVIAGFTVSISTARRDFYQQK
jgi:quinol-cytochrome oxidoreductase complex cytochrome b subunit